MFIQRGLVKVDGQIVNLLGFKVSRDAKIELLPEAIRSLRSRVTILLNKPVGYVSGQPEPGYVPAVRLIQRQTQVVSVSDDVLSEDHMRGLAPAGRLDIDSTGLLILTQDGVLAKSLIGEDSDIEKEYIVRVDGQMREGGLELLRHGLVLDGEPLKEAKVEWLNPDQLRFVLKEGKKRQIRRMCDEVGLRVLALKRVRIGNVRLGSLPEGRWRFLRPGENF
jgi:23S rRNA pseudouridine2604 synthase